MPSLPMIIKALRDEALPVYGDGKNVRDWIHVDDHCAGIVAVLFEGKPGTVYNFGGNSEMVNLDLVRMILDRLSKPHSLISFVPDRLGHEIRTELLLERDTYASVGARLTQSSDDLERAIRGFGLSAAAKGGPWRAAQKLAALAALFVLG